MKNKIHCLLFGHKFGLPLWAYNMGSSYSSVTFPKQIYKTSTKRCKVCGKIEVKRIKVQI